MQLGQWMGLLALALSLYILWQIRQVLLLVFAAVVVATSLNQLARRLQKTGMKRSWAVMLSISLLLTLIVGFLWLIVPPFATELKQLAELFPRAIDRLNPLLDQLRINVPAPLRESVPKDVASLNEQVQPLIRPLLTNSVAFLSSSLGVVVSFLLVLVLTLMLLVQPQSYRKTFVRLFPSFYRRRVDGILNQCEVALGRWIVGALISMSVVALLSIIGLSVLQVRLALAQGVLAGVLNFIPNLGPTLSVVSPMAIALLDAPWKAGAVFVLYFLIQQFESNLLTPYVMAQQVSLLPAVTLIAQVFFATFFGFLGLLLALPLTVVGQVWVKEVLFKDVLDQWRNNQSEEDDEAEVVVEAPNASSIAVDEVSAPTKNPPREDAQKRDRPQDRPADTAQK